MFVPNFKILGQVVAEKSLTEKKSLQTDRQADKHTNSITEKAKTTYPLYTSYTGGIIISIGVTILKMVKFCKKNKDLQKVQSLKANVLNVCFIYEPHC